MPRITYKCNFCGTAGFDTEKECEEHERRCEKRLEKTHRQYLKFFYDEKSKKTKFAEIEKLPDNIHIDFDDYNTVVIDKSCQRFPRCGYAVGTEDQIAFRLLHDYDKLTFIDGVDLKRYLHQEIDRIAGILGMLSEKLPADEDYNELAESIHNFYDRLINGRPLML